MRGPTVSRSPKTAIQSTTDHHIGVLRASRPHIELFRAWMEERDLAASTIERRLSTVCGFYRFAHIDGLSARTRPNTCAIVRFTRPMLAASTRSELGVLLFTAEQYDRHHAALVVLLGLDGRQRSMRHHIEDLEQAVVLVSLPY